MSPVEQPEYKLIHSKINIEIRDYLAMTIAEVEVCGERKEAISEGFKILADYIFGNNSSNKKMEMTAPVMQEQDKDKWKVRFVIPKRYSIEALPEPHSANVFLIALPNRRFAVLRFSGLAHEGNLKKHTDELKAYILAQSLSQIGEPIFAFYNPPWTLPFLRRNEVMIEIRS